MPFIKISRDFTETPGARYRTNGDFSGQEFRERFLIPAFHNSTETITVDLDDTDGYATSFLEEAFGGLAREIGSKQALARLKFISNQEKSLIDEVTSYIKDADA